MTGVLILVAATSLIAVGPRAQTVSLHGIGDLPGGRISSSAWGVSRDGVVVAGSSATEASGLNVEAARWTTDDGLIPLGFLPGAGNAFSRAWAVSDDGAVVIGISRSVSVTSREAFRWTPATGMVGLGDFPGGHFESTAYGLTPDGATIVGYGSQSPIALPTAFTWTEATGLVVLPVPATWTASIAYDVTPDGRVCAGYAGNKDTSVAAHWTNGAFEALPQPPSMTLARARGVSDDGTVVVGYARDAATNEALAVRWTPAGPEVLPEIPGGDVYHEAYAVSGDGRVVVGVSITGGAFVWTPERGTRLVRDALLDAGLDVGAWVLASAQDVSADGTVIVGNGTNPQGEREGWRAVLPRTTVAGEAPPAAPGLSVSVSPNPSAGASSVAVSLGSLSAVRVAVVDALGRSVAVLHEGSLAAGRHRLAVPSGLAAGVYAVRAEGAGGAAVARLAAPTVRLVVAR